MRVHIWGGGGAVANGGESMSNVCWHGWTVANTDLGVGQTGPKCIVGWVG